MIEVDTFEHAGLTIRIGAEEYIDENDDPRKNCDGNIGVMFCEHRDYNLGDDDAEDPRGHEIECDRCKGEGEVPEVLGDGLPSTITTETCPKCEGDGVVALSLTDYLKSIGCRVALPLFLYDHSGITISAGENLLAGQDNFSRQGRYAMDSTGWDVSSVGLIYHSPELCERWGRPKSDDAKIQAELEEEVKIYATYLEGGVYYYQILDGEDVLDTCGGFLDPDIWKDDCYTKQEARWAAEACREQLAQEHAEAHEMACRDIVTVG